MVVGLENAITTIKGNARGRSQPLQRWSCRIVCSPLRVFSQSHMTHFPIVNLISGPLADAYGYNSRELSWFCTLEGNYSTRHRICSSPHRCFVEQFTRMGMSDSLTPLLTSLGGSIMTRF